MHLKLCIITFIIYIYNNLTRNIYEFYYVEHDLISVGVRWTMKLNSDLSICSFPRISFWRFILLETEK